MADLEVTLRRNLARYEREGNDEKAKAIKARLDDLEPEPVEDVEPEPEPPKPAAKKPAAKPAAKKKAAK
jgi:hypothetical protein